MRKKGIPDILVKTVMSLYDGARTKVRGDSELSEQFEAKVGMHQGYVLSPLLFAVVVDVVTELARVGVLSKLMYADDSVLMAKIIDGLGVSKKIKGIRSVQKFTLGKPR